MAGIGLLAAALVLRFALAPLTGGNDFIAFHRLAALTLQGHDVYALGVDHRLGKALPWTYLPLLLYVFTAAQWLSLHLGWPFVVVGKLPIVVADLAVGALIYKALRSYRRSERVALFGMCCYLFNPFVLYNGAFYGRFDAIALAFLLLAINGLRSRRFAPAFALAVSAKTFPAFLALPLAVGHNRLRPRRLALAAGLVLALAVPYIITDPIGLAHIFVYVRHNFGRLSWYLVLTQAHVLPTTQVLLLARILQWLYPLLLLITVRGSGYSKAGQCFALYIVLNQVVYEQYLLWPLPFLIIMGLQERSWTALWLAAIVTVAGVLENEFTWERSGYLHYHLAPTPYTPLNTVLAVSVLGFVASEIIRYRRLEHAAGVMHTHTAT